MRDEADLMPFIVEIFIVDSGIPFQMEILVSGRSQTFLNGCASTKLKHLLSDNIKA